LTHVQDRLRKTIKHKQSQIKQFKKDMPRVQKEIDEETNSIAGQLRKAEGKILIERMVNAIKDTRRDIKLLEMQL